MTQTKTAAPTGIKTAAEAHTLPADFTIDAPMSAGDRIVAASMLSAGGWLANYNKLTTCGRAFRRLKKKAERTGRKLKAYELGGEL